MSCGLSCKVRGVWSVWYALRGEGCRVRGVWCAVAGAVSGAVSDVWCVVRGVWCAVRGALCVVRGAWCAVRGARYGLVWSQISTRSRTSAAFDFDGFGGCRGSPSFRIGDLDGI